MTENQPKTAHLPKVLGLLGLGELSQNQAIIIATATLGAFLTVLGATHYYLNKISPIPMEDPLLAASIGKVAENRAYLQHVETKTVVSDRDIRVVGDYMINHTYSEYASRATTTLSIPEEGGLTTEHQFTLTNIAIGDDVYSKIETESELLKKTIPHSTAWRRLKRDEIPPELNNIAIPGPILDNLKILSNKGIYLVVLKKQEEEVEGYGELVRYTLKLSKETPEEGTLGSVLQRIGSEGLVDLWIQESTSEPRIIRFENNSYHSTTTIITMTDIPRLTPPE